MQPQRFIREPECRAKTGLGRTTRYLMEQRGEFPKRIALSPRCVAWDEAEVDAFLEFRRSQPAPRAPVPSPQSRRRPNTGGV